MLIFNNIWEIWGFGDVLVKLGDYKLLDVMGYMEALSKFNKGDKTVLTIKRATEELSFNMQF